jgi:hypothetical protein
MAIFSVAKRVDPHSGLILRRKERHHIDCFRFLNRDEAKRFPFLYDRAKRDEVIVVDENDDSLWLVRHQEVTASRRNPPK